MGRSAVLMLLLAGCPEPTPGDPDPVRDAPDVGVETVEETDAPPPIAGVVYAAPNGGVTGHLLVHADPDEPMDALARLRGAREGCGMVPHPWSEAWVEGLATETDTAPLVAEIDGTPVVTPFEPVLAAWDVRWPSEGEREGIQLQPVRIDGYRYTEMPGVVLPPPLEVEFPPIDESGHIPVDSLDQLVVTWDAPPDGVDRVAVSLTVFEDRGSAWYEYGGGCVTSVSAGRLQFDPDEALLLDPERLDPWTVQIWMIVEAFRDPASDDPSPTVYGGRVLAAHPILLPR